MTNHSAASASSVSMMASMSASIASKDSALINNLVLGMGETGFACVKHLCEKGQGVKVFDDNLSDQKRQRLLKLSSDIQVFEQVEKSEQVLAKVDRLVVSPGVPLSHFLVKKAKEKSLLVVGDIELFCLENNKPIIAVTGSNAKSTVVTMLGLMAEASGFKPVVAGNIGKPVLEALESDTYDVAILELSSFQLDSTYSLKAKVAALLNISEDHLDRYDSYQDYQYSKHKIFENCEAAVFNLDEALSRPTTDLHKSEVTFGVLDKSKANFSLLSKKGHICLSYQEQVLLDVSEMPLQGTHQYSNALACLAVGHAAGFEMAAMLKVLKTFKGLPHRCELLGQQNGVDWFNDSKGTNVGASVAAIKSLGDSGSAQAQKNIILIAGGDSKGASLDALVEASESSLKSLLLIGKDADRFVNAFSGHLDPVVFSNLDLAVKYAEEISQVGDIVLLSPACASIDMYKNYMERGDHFKSLVASLLSSHEEDENA